MVTTQSFVTTEGNSTGSGVNSHGEQNHITTYITIVFEAILMAVILVANGIVICCFIKNRKLWKNITNYYIMQLALSDFATGLFTAFHIAVQVHPTFLENEYACLARYMSMMLVCSISLLSILLITYDRFVAIFRPFYYRSHASKCRVFLKCFIIDAIPIIVCLVVPLVWRRTLKEGENCLMVNILPFEYLACVLIPLYLATVIAKFTMYGIIFHKMARRFDRAKKMVKNRSSQSHEQLDRISKSNVALTKTGAIVLVSFTICWTPFFVHLIVQLSGVPESVYIANTISLATFMLILLNSALNPAIYVLRLPFFRRELKRALCGGGHDGGSFWESAGGREDSYRRSGAVNRRSGIYFLRSQSVLHRGRTANRLRDHRRQSGETLLSYRKRSDESVGSISVGGEQLPPNTHSSQHRANMLRTLSCPVGTDLTNIISPSPERDEGLVTLGKTDFDTDILSSLQELGDLTEETFSF